MPKTYAAVPDKATGDVFTEAMWDTYIRDNVNNLIVRPMCRVYNSAAQSLTTSVDTPLAMNSERFDNDSMHDTVTNNSRITIQTAGVYYVFGTVAIAANATGIRAAYVRLNGSGRITSTTLPAVSASSDAIMNISCIYNFTAGDYIELMALQTSGGALNSQATVPTSPEFGAVWIGRQA